MKKIWVGLVGLGVIGLGLVIDLTFTRGPVGLWKIDDHPLYVMRYAGDYGFDEYLKTGEYPRWESRQSEEAVEEAWGCTVFAALGEGGERLLGRNFDWYADHPVLLLFTDPPRGYASVSMVDLWYLGYTGKDIGLDEREALARAPYLPFDGMNEKGVAMGLMALPYGDGMRDPALRTLEDLELVRLVLDYAASVEEAIDLLEGYNVRFEGGIPLHYLVADAGGDSAVIEYVSGELRVLRHEQPWQVATNFILSVEQPVGAASSCPRYNTAYQTLQDSHGSLTSPHALDLLASTSQSGDFPTIWSAVYNLTTGEISIVIDRNYAQVYTFQLKRTPNP
jgi:hypothetical protein